MKQLKTKKRRSPWLNFAISGAVLVVLSLGITQMLPKSHPLRALRKLGGESDSASKPIEVQGAPLAVAGAVYDDANSENETAPKPKDQTNASPPLASVLSTPVVDTEKSAKSAARVHISHLPSRHSVVLILENRIGTKWRTRDTSPH